MKKVIFPVSGTPCNACTRVDLVALEVIFSKIEITWFSMLKMSPI
jgi:hypothetical protein